MAPNGAVAVGSARNPPPIVVPAIKQACENTVVPPEGRLTDLPSSTKSEGLSPRRIEDLNKLTFRIEENFIRFL